LLGTLLAILQINLYVLGRNVKKMIVLILLFLMIAVAGKSAHAVGAARGIGSEQSAHNFSHESWLPVTRICGVCHVPHRRRGKKRVNRYENGLLWNKKITKFTYNLYNSSWSSSLTGVRDTSWKSPITGKTGATPDGLSKLCLSCHNGVIAPDVFNLHHFVSLEYDVTQAELRDSDTTKIGVSGPISEVLDAGKIQCSSCHDAHDEESVAGTKLLRVDIKKVCMVCHKR
jgi:predicted CXXCH cytochrome family protein